VWLEEVLLLVQVQELEQEQEEGLNLEVLGH
jgi:hypothetical protein